jgi:Ala-tRNA(Pro) deacylase
MPGQKLKEFLEEKHIKYVSISHSTAYTAQEVAASAHVPGKEMAKTVMVKIDGKMAMAVLPANYQIDFNKLRELAGSKNVELASEEEFKYMFPDCEIGAMPPFGNLYDMKVYVAESLAEDEEIDFNACTHRELIRIKYKDFEKLVKPKKGVFVLGK